MRHALLLSLVVVLFSSGFAQTQVEETARNKTAAKSLIDFLPVRTIAAYRRDDKGRCQFELLSKQRIDAVEAYFENREANEQKRRTLQSQFVKARSENEASAENRLRIRAEIKKVSNPLGGLKLVEITDRGGDYIALRQLHFNADREYIIPTNLITMITRDLK